MNTIRYFDHETNRWATAISIWDGKELPMDNSGWRQQYDGRYGVANQMRELGGYLSQDDMRKAKNIPKAASSGTDWLRSSTVAPDAPAVKACACGKQLNMREAKLKLKRCQKCRDGNRMLKKPKKATRLPFDEKAA